MNYLSDAECNDRIVMAVAVVAKHGDFIRRPTERDRAIYRAGASSCQNDDAIRNAVAIFRWLNRKGGLGLDVHRRIDTFLSMYDAGKSVT